MRVQAFTDEEVTILEENKYTAFISILVSILIYRFLSYIAKMLTRYTSCLANIFVHEYKYNSRNEMGN